MFFVGFQQGKILFHPRKIKKGNSKNDLKSYYVKFSIFQSKICDFGRKNMKNTKTPKITSRVFYEILIKIDEKFSYSEKSSNLDLISHISK